MAEIYINTQIYYYTFLKKSAIFAIYYHKISINYFLLQRIYTLEISNLFSDINAMWHTHLILEKIFNNLLPHSRNEILKQWALFKNWRSE